MIDFIRSKLRNSAELKQELIANQAVLEIVANVTGAVVAAYRSGKKVLWCGNGGSAADAQHLAAELSGRFYYDRAPLNSEALHVNSSYLTAVANDYGYDVVYSRLVEAIGQQGDVLIGLSTSGNSANVVKALEKAKTMKMVTVGFTGITGGLMNDHCDHLLKIPSKDTPRIQECHMLFGHTICERVEMELFPRKSGA